MDVRAETFQNEYLPNGGTDVHAVVSVAATGGRGSTAATAPETAVVIIIDASGSMSPRVKLGSAKRAAVAAVQRLRDGVHFGVLAGAHDARWLYPHTGLAVAGAETRAAAERAIGRMSAHGGTAMGQWLMAAHHRLSPLTGAIRQVILLTDGQDESETREYLEAVVERCVGVFQCDCRGVGTQWRVDELRMVASRLLGTVDIVAAPEDMPADFEAIIGRAMAKRAADLTLRVWTPRGASIAFVKQVAPMLEDLTDRAVRVDDRTVEFATGAWGDESRDYHLHLVVPAQDVGAEMLAARVSLACDGEVLAQGLVRAVWTDDLATSTRIHPQVAHYTGQAELAAAIADGLEARASGDDATATTRLGRAAQLATATGHDGTLRLLARVVDIVDAGTGTVRLRGHVDEADAMALDTRSTRTVRTSAERD